MPKVKSLYLPLPLPKTSESKWCMYLDIGTDIEMVLYDGDKVYCVDFPDIPIEQLETGFGDLLDQNALQNICKHLMSTAKVLYNEEFNIWEAVYNNI